FFFQAEDGIRDWSVTGVKTCALPISRILGSRASRRASPNRLKPKTVSAIARPGKMAIHGAVEAYSSAPPCNIRPHAAVGSWTPRSEERRVGEGGRSGRCRLRWQKGAE